MLTFIPKSKDNSLKKDLKILMMVVGVIVLPITIFVGILYYAVWSESWSASESGSRTSLQELFIENLNMPKEVSRSHTSRKYQDYSDNSWLDLEPIALEEWKDVQCSYPDHERVKWSINYQYKDSKQLSEEQKKHYYCIQPGIEILSYGKSENIFEYLNINNKSPWSSDLFSKTPCITVTFHEYILSYPQIFNNILKIAEKPCFYLKNSGMGSWHYKKLYCNSFGSGLSRVEKTCILIEIVDSQGIIKNQIRIPRKDNIHLLNQSTGEK